MYCIFIFICPQIVHNFFAFIPEKSQLQPVEVKSRDLISLSLGSSSLPLGHEDSSRYSEQLKTDEEESSSIAFGASDIKYLLYEDEQDFKVRFIREQL